ncbi:MAG TPA: AMP-binding protein [Actinomycetota bacterium]|nr:AMP-binding protein [Actinomycetota bacterium]
MNDVIWEPDASYIEGSNVKRLMDRNGISSYEELVERSVADVEWYWSEAEKDLGLEWARPYDKICDDHQGMQWSTWFVGGQINIAHNCVDRHATGPRAGKTALIWEGEDGSARSVTYSRLAEEVATFANALRSLGLGKGDPIGVYMPMTIEAVVAMMAIAKIGGIYLPIFSGFAASAVAVRLIDAGAKALVTADGFFRRGQIVEMKEEADKAAHEAGVPITIIHSRIGRDIEWHKHDHWWHDLVHEQQTTSPTEETDSEDVWMVAYTSGTTGKPKGSVHVHGGFLVKIASEVAYQVDLREDDVLYWVTDMGWIMGQWQTVGGLAVGGTVVLYEGAPNFPDPGRVWSICERHGVTILGMSPTLVRALIPAGDDPVKAHDLSKLRIFGSTGEPWNEAPYRWLFETVGGGRCPIINLSGGTEVGACFLSPYPITNLKAMSLRGPSLGMAVDVVGPDGQSVRGEVGELVCRKPWPAMTRGIWGDPDRYIESYWSRFPGIWTHGDWASIDNDGHWFLHGRSDDTLNIAGKRIGPAEFESVLVSHPKVAEAAAVGIDHEVKGEAVWCFCVLNPGEEGSPELQKELTSLVDAEIGKAFRPQRIVFVPELPRTRSAKILRRAIRAKVMGEDPGDLTSLENPGALEAIDAALRS